MKRFEGWEPKTRTKFRYDDSGRLMESTSVPEIEWDDEQQAWMLALAALEHDTCSGCGGRLTETTETGVEYVPTPPIRCHKCTALEIGIEQHRTSPHPHALLHNAKRRDE